MTRPFTKKIVVLLQACLLTLTIGVLLLMPGSDAFAADGLISGPLSYDGSLCYSEGQCTQCDIARLVSSIATGTMAVVGPIATFAIVVSGVMYILSAGKAGSETNIAGIERAKSALKASIIGAIVAITAWVLVNFILQAMGYTGFGSWQEIQCQVITEEPATDTD